MTPTLSIRIPPDVLADIEKLKENPQYLSTGGDFVRARVIVGLIRQGLEARRATENNLNELERDMAALKANVKSIQAKDACALAVKDTPANRELLAMRQKILSKKRIQKTDKAELRDIQSQIEFL